MSRRSANTTLNGIMRYLSLIAMFQQTICHTGSCSSYFTLVDRLLKHSSDPSHEMIEETIVSCANTCNINSVYLSFVYNTRGRRCQVFSKPVLTRQNHSTSPRNLTFIKVNTVCKVPSVIPKGRLLFIDGLQEGSRALFLCEDFHFTNITHGVCRADGVWEGLDKPCVHVPGPLYVLLSDGRIAPGKCMVTLARLIGNNSWGAIFFYQRIKQPSSIRRVNSLVNSFISGEWGLEKWIGNYWTDRKTETNLTICIDVDVYRLYTNETLICKFKHRVPVAEVHYIRSHGLHLRSMRFTSRKKS